MKYEVKTGLGQGSASGPAVVDTDGPPSTRREKTVYLIHGTGVAPAVTKTSTVPVCASQF